MNNYKIIEVKESIFKNNDERAVSLRLKLKENKTFFINLMSSPGSGKTTTLLAILNVLKDKLRIGVMEADIEGDIDSEKVSKENIKVIQLLSGGLCHLDSDMTLQGLTNLGYEDLDLVFLENIGNLVCPAEFDTGAHLNMMILSIPEGDDKPLKYPLMFQISDIVIINKIDTLEYFDFDIEKAKSRILKVNPKAKIFLVSSKLKQGTDELANYIYDEYLKYNGE